MKITSKIYIWCVIMIILNVFVVIFMNSNDLNIFKWIIFLTTFVWHLVIIYNIFNNTYDGSTYTAILDGLINLSCLMDLVLFTMFSTSIIIDNPNVINIVISILKFAWVGPLILIKYMYKPDYLPVNENV